MDGGDVAERGTALILHPATIAFGDRGGVLLVDQDDVQFSIGGLISKKIPYTMSICPNNRMWR